MSSLYDNFTSFSDCESIQLGPTLVKLLKETCKLPTSATLFSLNAEENKILESIKAENRRFEYERARLLIRNSLQYKGPLTKDDSGAPTWPKGLVGSLSHTDRMVALTVERLVHFSGIGVDIENISRVGWHLKEKIINNKEEALLQQKAKEFGVKPSTLLALVFSFKEVIFKCIFPIGKTMFYFPDAEIVTINENHTISGKLLCSPSKNTPKGFVINGNYKFFKYKNNDYIITSARIPAIIDF